MNILLLNRCLLISIFLIGLTACNSEKAIAKKGDSWLLYKTHHSIVPKKPNWKRAEFKEMSYFGRYRASADPFQRYGGDPLGPIVAIWKVARFLGEKPVLVDCGKEPKLADDLIWNTPKYKSAKKEKNKLLRLFKNCRRDNADINKQATTFQYYYARSPNNYAIVAKPRPEGHASYEVNVSYGPLIGVSPEGLTPEYLMIKDKLYYGDCRNLGLDDADKSCYRLPGEDSNLYYSIRSLLRNSQTGNGASSAYQKAPFINDIPVKWEEIKGINITAKQYDYLAKRCQKIFECYLDDNAPDLSKAQKVYLKATQWNIDTDFIAQDKLIAKANAFRFYQKN